MVEFTQGGYFEKRVLEKFRNLQEKACSGI